MSLDNPFKESSYRGYWIFIERATLDQFLLELSKSPPQASPAEPLANSPVGGPAINQPPPNLAEPSIKSALSANPFRQPPDHLRRLVAKALLSLYGSATPPLGETAKRRLEKVEAWVKRETGQAYTIGVSTVYRAMVDLHNGKYTPAGLGLV
jgi:hypothetical protein